jgi:hypothetical protein
MDSLGFVHALGCDALGCDALGCDALGCDALDCDGALGCDALGSGPVFFSLRLHQSKRGLAFDLIRFDLIVVIACCITLEASF